MVRKKLPYDTIGLPYDVYMGDPRPQCIFHLVVPKPLVLFCFFRSYFGPKAFKYEVILGLVNINNSWPVFFGFPASLGIRMTVNVSQRVRGLALNNTIEVML